LPFKVILFQNGIQDNGHGPELVISGNQLSAPQPGPVEALPGYFVGRIHIARPRVRPSEHYIHDHEIRDFTAQLRQMLPELVLGVDTFDPAFREGIINLVYERPLLQVVVFDNKNVRASCHVFSLGSQSHRE
jgi:hypothetical protein